MNATLSWIENAETDLRGYRIYLGRSPGLYSQVVELTTPQSAGPLVKEWTALDLIDGVPYFFAISAFDTVGNESALSTEVQKTNRYVTIRG